MAASSLSSSSSLLAKVNELYESLLQEERDIQDIQRINAEALDAVDAADNQRLIEKYRSFYECFLVHTNSNDETVLFNDPSTVAAKLEVKTRHLHTLRPGTLLVDSVVALLVESIAGEPKYRDLNVQVINPSFSNVSATTARKTKLSFAPNMTPHKTFLFVQNVGGCHWILLGLVYNEQDRDNHWRLYIMDSYPSATESPEQVQRKLMLLLLKVYSFGEQLKTSTRESLERSLANAINVPMQTDGTSCGLFVAQNARVFLNRLLQGYVPDTFAYDVRIVQSPDYRIAAFGKIFEEQQQSNAHNLKVLDRNKNYQTCLQFSNIQYKTPRT